MWGTKPLVIGRFLVEDFFHFRQLLLDLRDFLAELCDFFLEMSYAIAVC